MSDYYKGKAPDRYTIKISGFNERTKSENAYAWFKLFVASDEDIAGSIWKANDGGNQPPGFHCYLHLKFEKDVKNFLQFLHGSTMDDSVLFVVQCPACQTCGNGGHATKYCDLRSYKVSDSRSRSRSHDRSKKHSSSSSSSSYAKSKRPSSSSSSSSSSLSSKANRSSKKHHDRSRSPTKKSSSSSSSSKRHPNRSRSPRKPKRKSRSRSRSRSYYTDRKTKIYDYGYGMETPKTQTVPQSLAVYPSMQFTQNQLTQNQSMEMPSMPSMPPEAQNYQQSYQTQHQDGSVLGLIDREDCQEN